MSHETRLISIQTWVTFNSEDKILEKLVAKSSDAGTWKGVYLVRGADGHVKYDDPHNVPQEILDALTDEDRAHLEKLKQET